MKKSAKSIALGFGLFCMGLTFSACHVGTGGAVGDDTTNADLAATSLFLGQALAQDGTLLASHALTDSSCSSNTFSACNADGDMTLDFSLNGGDSGGCSEGSLITVFGQALLSFSSTTCAFLTGDSMTRTLTNYYTQDLSGRKLVAYTGAGTVAGQTITSTGLVDYTGTSYSGGTVVEKTNAGVSVYFNGIHRRSLASGGAFGFWHTIYSPESMPISVTGSSGNWTINSGSYNISHNLANVTVVHTLNSVEFDDTCCYPLNGTSTLTPGSQAPIVLTWSSTCGSVLINNVQTTLVQCGS